MVVRNSDNCSCFNINHRCIGQSGSPVLVKDRNTSIGAHVYGLGNINSASVIKGTYGNLYAAYIDSFSSSLQGLPSAQGVSVLKVERQAEDAFTDVTPAEGFWDTLKKVSRIGPDIGSTVLGGGSPFMGPLIGPIAAAAGTALGLASKLVDNSNKSESEFEAAPNHKAHAARAMLAEAALQTVLKMDVDQITKYGVAQHMQNSFQKNKPNLRIVKILAPTIMDSTLRIAMNASTSSTTAPATYPNIPSLSESIVGPARNFADGLITAAQGDAHEEGFFEFIKAVVTTGVKTGGPLIGTIGKLIGGSESDMEPAISEDSTYQHLETLCHRSIMGEAALEAIMSIPPEELHAEGFFGSITDTIKSIGSTVVRVAPSVMKTVVPIIQTLVAPAMPGETPVAKPKVPTTSDGKLKAPTISPVKKATSLADLLGGGSAKDLEKLDVPENAVSQNAAPFATPDIYFGHEFIPDVED
jgi:hypothetical protein